MNFPWLFAFNINNSFSTCDGACAEVVFLNLSEEQTIPVH